MKEYNVENICGYTVHSYYVEAPRRTNDNKKSLSGKRKNIVLRYFAFIALAPFALAADAVIAIFK